MAISKNRMGTAYGAPWRLMVESRTDLKIMVSPVRIRVPPHTNYLQIAAFFSGMRIRLASHPPQRAPRALGKDAVEVPQGLRLHTRHEVTVDVECGGHDPWLTIGGPRGASGVPLPCWFVGRGACPLQPANARKATDGRSWCSRLHAAYGDPHKTVRHVDREAALHSSNVRTDNRPFAL